MVLRELLNVIKGRGAHILDFFKRVLPLQANDPDAEEDLDPHDPPVYQSHALRTASTRVHALDLSIAASRSASLPKLIFLLTFCFSWIT